MNIAIVMHTVVRQSQQTRYDHLHNTTGYAAA